MYPTFATARRHGVPASSVQVQVSLSPHLPDRILALRTGRAGVSKLFDKITRGATELGWQNFIFYSIDRLLIAVSGGRARLFCYSILAQPVATTPFLPAHRGANIEVREIYFGDPIIAMFPRTLAMVEDRFKQGSRCFVATRKGEFMGYIWLSFNFHLEDEVRARYQLPSDPNAAWDFDVYVVPAQRLGFTFLRLWDTVYADLCARQIQWSISRIAVANLGSLAAHARLGATPIARANFLVLGPMQIMFSNCAPRIHMSFSHGMPTLFIPTPTCSERRN